MFGSTFLSYLGAARGNANRPPSQSAPHPRSPRLSSGGILTLCALGVAASLTVAACFGAGLLLLLRGPGATAAGASAVAGAVHGSAPPKFAAIEAPPAIAGKPEDRRENAAPSPAPTVIAPPARPSAAPAAREKSAPAPAEPDADTAKPASAATPPPPSARTPPAPAAAPQPGVEPPAASAAPPQLSTTEISALLARGDAAFRRGDLTSARLFYQRAFEAGQGRGALGMGATYDPYFLHRFGFWNQRADPAEARAWYDRARDLGTAEAEQRLKKLNR